MMDVTRLLFREEGTTKHQRRCVYTSLKRSAFFCDGVFVLLFVVSYKQAIGSTLFSGAQVFFVGRCPAAQV